LDDRVIEKAGGKRQTTPIDTVIGVRLRAVRLQAGWSQSELAARLNVTFQQIQKYEKGSNRLSAASLHQIAQLFKLPLDYFFEGGDAGNNPASGLQTERSPVRDRAEARLIAHYRKVSPHLQSRFAALLQAIVGSDQDIDED